METEAQVVAEAVEAEALVEAKAAKADAKRTATTEQEMRRARLVKWN